MRVIVDSGSTKADWYYIDGERQVEKNTVGLNPLLYSEEHLNGAVLDSLPEGVGVEDISRVYFYSAGCSTQSSTQKMHRVLSSHFIKAHIEVESDLIGAARALIGSNGVGICCILGTGSNSCLYQNDVIVEQIPPLGYLLGDEGSGAWLGKQLLRAFFYEEMHESLAADFEAFLGMDRATVFIHLYHKEAPNKYLASLSRFLIEKREDVFIQNLIKQSFLEFIDRHVSKYTRSALTPVHFVGSIAYHYQKELKACLYSRCMRPGRILKKPIDGLIDFHTKLD